MDNILIVNMTKCTFLMLHHTIVARTGRSQQIPPLTADQHHCRNLVNMSIAPSGQGVFKTSNILIFVVVHLSIGYKY